MLVATVIATSAEAVASFMLSVRPANTTEQLTPNIANSIGKEASIDISLLSPSPHPTLLSWLLGSLLLCEDVLAVCFFQTAIQNR